MDCIETPTLAHKILKIRFLNVYGLWHILIILQTTISIDWLDSKQMLQNFDQTLHFL